MAAKPPAVLVVGAGVIGLACAFRIAREGRRVILVDREAPGRGASFGNAGHIATEQIFPLASPEVVRDTLRYLLDRESALRIRPAYALRILPWLVRFAWAARRSSFERGVAAIAALQQTAREELAELMAMAGASRLVHVDGHLVLVERAQSLAAAKSEVELMAAHGVRADWLAPAEVRVLAPEIVAPIEGAWRFSGTGHVDDPYAVSTALADAFREAGGEILQAEVTTIEGRGEQFVARASGGREIDASHVVLACGAWSKPLASRLGYDVPLDTERGYHITLPRAFPAFRIPVASFERKVIMTPMTAGLRMTGTVEFGGLRLAPDPNRFTILKRHLAALAPSLPAQGLTTWIGFRPSLPDHLPVLGRVPDGRNLFFAFGHQHLGLTLAGVTARIIADQVAGRDPAIDLRPYSPARF
ncbi:MAG: FAD-dependent oxidoreductase [Burkholderiales bacterium]|nr:FAD-dependent oxidoreductase [Burkholderiales bacterium]